MSWLRVDEALADDPAIFRASAMLGLDDSDLFLGKFIRLSSWISRYAPDGDLQSFDATEIAKGAGWTGDAQVFLDALQTSGLVTKKDDRLELRDWWEMQGKHREYRKRDAERKAKERAAEQRSEGRPNAVQQSSEGHPEDFGTDVRTDGKDETDGTEGKDGTHERTNSLPMNDEDDFEVFWKVFPRRVGKEDARKAWNQTAELRPPISTIVEKLEVLKGSRDWTKDNGQYIPYPTTWLRRGGWNDEVTPSNSNIHTFGGRDEPSHPEDIARYSGADGSPPHPMWDKYDEVHTGIDGPWERFDDWLARQDWETADAIKPDPSTNLRPQFGKVMP